MAAVAAHPQETVLETAAFEVILEFPLDIPWQLHPLCGQLGHERRIVLLLPAGRAASALGDGVRNSVCQYLCKRLRTAAGDLGDISFRATLKDGAFRMDPFRVGGWAGALIESDVAIDASQNPPVIALNWIARQLSYGVLLEQAGFAETVEGDIDVTLRLSGKGRSRYEFLGHANGQIIIVGQEGRFGSRRLDLWGSDLVTTMLSREWRRDDVTDLNCLVARISA